MYVYPQDGKRLMASIERVKICLHNLVLVIWIDVTRKACWYLKNFTLSCQLIMNYHHCYVGWVSLAQSWHWLPNYFQNVRSCYSSIQIGHVSIGHSVYDLSFLRLQCNLLVLLSFLSGKKSVIFISFMTDAFNCLFKQLCNITYAYNYFLLNIYTARIYIMSVMLSMQWIQFIQK